MASRSFSIAEAYATWLNDEDRDWPSIDSEWTAARVDVPRADLADLGGALAVELVALGQQGGELIDRSRRQLDWIIGLSLRQHYDAGGAVAADWLAARVALIEAIARATREITPTATLSGQPSGYAVWVETVEIESLYDLRALDETMLFSSQMLVTFREVGPR